MEDFLNSVIESVIPKPTKAISSHKLPLFVFNNSRRLNDEEWFHLTNRIFESEIDNWLDLNGTI